MRSVSALLLALTAVVAGVEFAVVLARRPRTALAAAIVAAIASALALNISKSVGGFNLTLQDFVCFALAVAIALRVTFHWGRRPDRAVVLVLGIIVLNVARGANQFGLQAAANEARELVYFLVTAAFFSTVHVDFGFIVSFRRVLLAAAVFLTGVASVFWLRHGLGTFAANGSRALTGSAAFLILAATIIAVVLPVGRVGFRWLFPVVGFGVLLLSEQRTVWVAAVASIATLYFFSTRVGARRTRRTLSAMVAVGGAAVALALASGSSGVDKSITTAYGSSLSRQGTFSWRIAGWTQLIHRQVAEPFGNILLGNPAGTGFLRVVNGGTVSVAPHSEYVTLFVTVGLLSLTVLVVAYGSRLRQLARIARGARTDLALGALVMLTVLIAELVYFSTYSLGFSGGLLFGVATGLVRSHSRSAEEQRSAKPARTKSAQMPALRPEPDTNEYSVDPRLAGRRVPRRVNATETARHPPRERGER
jgi:hypothetical protein